MKPIKRITIDLNRPRTNTVQLVQGDTARQIAVVLMLDGMPYDVSADTSDTIVMGVAYIKANGVDGYYEETTTGDDAVTAGDNAYTLIVALDNHATDVPGLGAIFLRFSTADGLILHSFPVKLFIDRSSASGGTDPNAPYYQSNSFLIAGSQATKTAAMTMPVGVDANGVLWSQPCVWTTITSSSGTYSSSMTLSEIQTARAAGYIVKAHLPDNIDSDFMQDDSGAIFWAFDDSGGSLILLKYCVQASSVTFDTYTLSGSGVTEALKTALLDIAENVAWATDDGQTYYQNLYDALNPEPTPAGLTSITASYDQDHPIYSTDSLETVITTINYDLTVVANYSDGTSETLSASDYTISGTVEAGASVPFTVAYGGKTATINVLILDASVVTGYEAIGSPTISNNILTVESGKFVRSTVALSPASGESWKVRMKLKYNNLPSNFANVVGGAEADGSFAKTFVIQNNNATQKQFIMYVSADKSNWSVRNLFGGSSGISAGNWYYFEFGYDGTKYYHKLYEGGWDGTEKETAEFTSSVTIYNGCYVGFGVKSTVNGFDGQIDLTECKMYVDDALVWQAV